MAQDAAAFCNFSVPPCSWNGQGQSPWDTAFAACQGCTAGCLPGAGPGPWRPRQGTTPPSPSSFTKASRSKSRPVKSHFFTRSMASPDSPHRPITLLISTSRGERSGFRVAMAFSWYSFAVIGRLPDEVLQKAHRRADIPLGVVPHLPLDGEEAPKADVV